MDYKKDMHLVKLSDWTPELMNEVLDLSIKIKQNKYMYSDKLIFNSTRKLVVHFFDKASLRTRLSFVAGSAELGGIGEYYPIDDKAPLGKKEDMHDTAKCTGRYAALITARLGDQKQIEELAAYSGVPVINAMTNAYHPCQIVADLQTAKEHLGKLKGKTLSYVGVSNNNVTHSLIIGSVLTGMNVNIGCPKNHAPSPSVIKDAEAIAKKTGSKIMITDDAKKAVRGSHVVSTDTWMSYHIKPEEKAARLKIFKPYQVNAKLMHHAAQDAIFMHCLPAQKGNEVTKEIIETAKENGGYSVVFDEAENRLHAQKGIMVYLLDKWYGTGL